MNSASIVRNNDGAGSGRITLNLHGRQAIFSELSYRYPLKLLSPRVQCPSVAIAYVLTYGGGLVSGDRINLHVSVDSNAALVLLTQVNTSGCTIILINSPFLSRLLKGLYKGL